MERNEEAMLKALVAIAWADGRFADEESEVVEAMIATLKLGSEGADLIRSYAKEPRSLDDVPVADLGTEDRTTLFRHAVILSHIDGGQDDDERALLIAVAARLGIADEEAARLIAAGEKEASALLDL